MAAHARTVASGEQTLTIDRLAEWAADPRVLALADRLRQWDQDRVPLGIFQEYAPLVEAWQTAGLCQSEEKSAVSLTSAGRMLVFGLSEYSRWRDQRQSLESALLRESGLPPGAVVLDVGCGAGARLMGLLSLAPRMLIGVDPDPMLLRLAGAVAALEGGRAASAVRATWVRGRAESVPLGSGRVDAVLCRNTFHLLHTVEALAEMSRLLRSGGLAVIQFHDWRFYGSRLFARRVRRLLPDTLLTLLLGTVFHWTGHQRRITVGRRRWSEVYHSTSIFRRLGAPLGLSLLRTIPARSATCPICVLRKTGAPAPQSLPTRRFGITGVRP